MITTKIKKTVSRACVILIGFGSIVLSLSSCNDEMDNIKPTEQQIYDIPDSVGGEGTDIIQ